MRLLLVEDDEKIGGFVAQGLRQEGHVVDWGRNGEEGLRARAGGRAGRRDRRFHASRPRRAEPDPRAARAPAKPPDHHPQREERRRGLRHRPRRRRRRLPHQAVLLRRAARARARAGASLERRRRGRTAALVSRISRSICAVAARDPRRAVDRAASEGVHAPRVSLAQRRPRALQDDDPRARLGATRSIRRPTSSTCW